MYSGKDPGEVPQYVIRTRHWNPEVSEDEYHTGCKKQARGNCAHSSATYLIEQCREAAQNSALHTL
jgi:hypothetical protein